MKKVSEVIERQILDAQEILDVYNDLILKKILFIESLEMKCKKLFDCTDLTPKYELYHQISTLKVELVELEHKCRVKKEVFETKTQEQKEWLKNVEDTAKIANKNFDDVLNQVSKLTSRAAVLEVKNFEENKDKILADQELKNITYQKFLRVCV